MKLLASSDSVGGEIVAAGLIVLGRGAVDQAEKCINLKYCVIITQHPTSTLLENLIINKGTGLSHLG